MGGIDSLKNWSYHHRRLWQPTEKEEKKRWPCTCGTPCAGWGSSSDRPEETGRRPAPCAFPQGAGRGSAGPATSADSAARLENPNDQTPKGPQMRALSISGSLPPPQGPRQVVSVRTMGEFRLAVQALVVLLLEAPGVFPPEKPGLIHLHQVFMRSSVARFPRLFFAPFTNLHAHSHPVCFWRGPCQGYLQRIVFLPSSKSTSTFCGPTTRWTRPRPKRGWFIRDLTL